MTTTIEAKGAEKPMEYQEFKEELVKQVQERLGSGIRVEHITVFKNNDTKCEELTCRSRDSNMNPAIRIWEMYERYQILGMEWCVERVVAILGYRKSIDIEQMWGSWEMVKGRVMPKLVNQTWNRKRLNDLPHRSFLDLAVLFRLRYPAPNGEEALLTVTRKGMKQWGIRLEELYEAAYENLKKEGEITAMPDLLEGMGVEGGEQLYILSNRSRLEGAAALLCTDLLKEFADRQGTDYFLLPSSVHEWILFPDRGAVSVSALREMVREINWTEVEQEEWLSDEVYYFSRNTGEVTRL